MNQTCTNNSRESGGDSAGNVVFFAFGTLDNGVDFFRWVWSGLEGFPTVDQTCAVHDRSKRTFRIVYYLRDDGQQRAPNR
ncbi:hypothetical protein SAMN05421752_101129 [Natronorubrum thiooxidans]|uniref:Uncharacterized protein n=1 Tax=Natronorubrum thiooxidans TaxID=308853 RepID=A0A1N7C5I0_9EURY|nr:hypothetical protein SAMN05421752_101129 [Natronorubrum thiooxidans]